MMLPEKLIAPMIAESAIVIVSSGPAMVPPLVSLSNSPSATSAAAPPPQPLTAATICGIAVILTARAA